MDHDAALLVFQAIEADDDLLGLALPVLGEIDAGEEGLQQHALVALDQVGGKGAPGQDMVDLGGQLLQVLGG